MVACELPHLPSIDACAKFDVGAAARHGGPTSPPTASTIDKSIKDAFTGKASDTKSTDSLAALCLHQSSIQTPELSKVVSQCKTLQQLWVRDLIEDDRNGPHCCLFWLCNALTPLIG
ncbi:uncharacterized protein LOC122047626 isoform X4 [Zingiber officinale]|uniref:uncharacterized protein LOC122047626 isoform X4 n=1 Tax=Zingiber officinale TaxID=94328 RepID=UPI001C4C0B22|nr:uncharacterized protein LOC122047626 isoform X4 [Zingiber officinale]